MMAKTSVPSEFAPEIRRARIDCLTIYELSESELEILEKGSPSSIYLNFAIFSVSVALTLFIALLTTEIKSIFVSVVFVVMTFTGISAGFLLLLLWWRNNKSITKLVNIIRNRLPREEVPPTQE